jgi:hypothetical protein
MGQLKRSILLGGAIALGLLTVARAEDPEPSFPVPRAEREFRQLIAFPRGAGANGPMEPREYLALAGPYAPLDLQVTRARDASEASLLKNLYLGVCGHFLNIDTARLANAFHCGPECTRRRKAYATERLDRFSALAGSLRKVRNVVLVAQWGQPGSLRVNDMFKLGGWVREAIPSPELGFVPSGQWHEYATLEAFFSARGIDGPATLAIVESAGEAGAGAVVRLQDDAVRVFLPGGIGDNQAGLLFQDPSLAAPRVGATTPDGFETVVTETLSPGVYYFETS